MRALLLAQLTVCLAITLSLQVQKRSELRNRSEMAQIIIFSTKFIMFDTKMIILSTKFILFDTK